MRLVRRLVNEVGEEAGEVPVTNKLTWNSHLLSLAKDWRIYGGQ